MYFRRLILLVFAPLSFCSFVYADESVILTVATGGHAIRASSFGGEFTVLSPIIFKETNHAQIGPDNTDLIINLPSGFEFDVSNNGVRAIVVNTKLDESGNCAGAGNKTLRLGMSQSGATSDSLTATSNSITLHIKQASAGNCKGTLTFSGIKVRPTSSSVIASGNMTYGGTTQIAGIEVSQTSLGALQMIDDIERDLTAPTITLNGESVVVLEVHSIFTDPGAVAHDDKDGNVEVVAAGIVDMETLGEYIITYSATDSSGNLATSVTRTVQVVDTTAPTITLNGENIVNIKKGNTFTDLGAEVEDNYDEDLTASVSGVVDTDMSGTYILRYEAVDSSENQAEVVTRTVNVFDVLPPVITLIGQSDITIEAGENYVDSGATAVDGNGDDITSQINVTGLPVNAMSPGTYTITYRVSVIDGQDTVSALPVIRRIRVVDTKAPIITLIGESIVSIRLAEIYIDPGATAQDIVDGNMTDSIDISGLPVSQTVGSHNIIYSVSDSSGNGASLTRIVNVLENTALPPLPENENQEPRSGVVETNSRTSGSSSKGRTFSFSSISNSLSNSPINWQVPGVKAVLGASTSKTCEMKQINTDNFFSGQIEETKKLQQFLNSNLILAIPVTGVVDDLTIETLLLFKMKYASELAGQKDILEFLNSLICKVD